ncbi:HNH endonuclease [Caballeronia sp. RCC_10]|uniref:HNH endonuclease n=1 Tax=Caballeronia sp. RCC_10 TaxID=3239227 RepID=UPI0035240CD8
MPIWKSFLDLPDKAGFHGPLVNFFKAGLNTLMRERGLQKPAADTHRFIGRDYVPQVESTSNMPARRTVMTVVWTVNDLPEPYRLAVLKNMADKGHDVVRFGATGKGIQPNYETGNSSETVAYNGGNHQPSGRKRYNRKHLLDTYRRDGSTSRFVIAQEARATVDDFLDAFRALKRISRDALAMLDCHADAPAARATLEELAHHFEPGADEQRVEALTDAYMTFAERVAQRIKLPHVTGLDVLATWDAATQAWTLKPEVRRALEDKLAAEAQWTASLKTKRNVTKNERVGHDQYSRELRELWDGRCAVTGCSHPSVLRASHATAWAEASDVSRDPFNGLLLHANLDALFDNGEISFDDKGKMLISPRVPGEYLDTLGVPKGGRLWRIYPRNLPYLRAHRKKYGF